MNDLDWATVRRLRATSSPEALEAYYRSEWGGLPAYDVLPPWVKDLQPRDRIARCAVCGAPYPQRSQAEKQKYCSHPCQQAAWEEDHRGTALRRYHENRERYNAAKRARRRQQREEAA